VSFFPSHYIIEDFILTDLITRMKAELAAVEAAPSPAALNPGGHVTHNHRYVEQGGDCH
jgi:hypothetical protein